MAFDPFEDSKQKELQEKRKRKREQELEDLKKVLKTPEGERVLWRIIKKTKFLDSSWTGNSTTFFNEGMREVGRILLAEITEAAPDQLGKFFEQALKKEIE
jgi:hypothetical protein